MAYRHSLRASEVVILPRQLLNPEARVRELIYQTGIAARSYVPEFDGLRGLACALVVAFHVSLEGVPPILVMSLVMLTFTLDWSSAAMNSFGFTLLEFGARPSLRR
jgi:hypothetical protein